MPGVSFDRATDYYDATRGLPPEVRDEVAGVLCAELTGRGRCLEIGVGTGRIALPLHERGIDVIGADLSLPMLNRLVANAAGHRPLSLLVGDATSLPLIDGCVGAVVASHVLHLLADWRHALDEARRVLAPAGVLLVDFGGVPAAPWSEGTRRVLEAAGVFHVRPGVSEWRLVADYLGPSADVRPLRPVSMSVARSLGMDLRDWQQQLHAWTWAYSPAQIGAACDEVRRWATAEGIDLDAIAQLERVIQWWEFKIS